MRPRGRFCATWPTTKTPMTDITHDLGPVHAPLISDDELREATESMGLIWDYLFSRKVAHVFSQLVLEKAADHFDEVARMDGSAQGEWYNGAAVLLRVLATREGGG